MVTFTSRKQAYRFFTRQSLGLCGAWLAAALAFAQSSSVPQAQDLGQAAANGGSSSVRMTFSFPSAAAAPSFSLAYGVDFTLGAPSCTVASGVTCSILITFNPHTAGVRGDGLIVKYHSGNYLGTTLLHGMALAPQMVDRKSVV